MGKRTKEFKCQGECRTDWRDVWERSLRATTPQHLRPANSNGSEIQDDARIQKRLTAFVNGEEILKYSHFAATSTSSKGGGAPPIAGTLTQRSCTDSGISTSAVKARVFHARVASIECHFCRVLAGPFW